MHLHVLSHTFLVFRLEVGVGSTTELTQEGLGFLTNLFDRYDKVNISFALSDKSTVKLFSAVIQR